MDNDATNQQPNNEELEKLQNRIGELENCWKRALADYQNLEKRVEEEKKVWRSYATEMLVKDLLPVLDNMETLYGHLQDDGLKLTLKDFKQILANSGLQEIESTGKDFDPTVMEAIDMVPGEKNKVIETTLKGYFLQDKLLRPAKVKVGSGQTSEEKASEEPAKEE